MNDSPRDRPRHNTSAASARISAGRSASTVRGKSWGSEGGEPGGMVSPNKKAARARGVAPAGPLPAPKISDITPRTKDQHGIGVAYGGVPTLIAAPVSWPKMRAIAVDLVLAGAHPEDILVWDYDPVLSRTEPA